MLIMLDVAIAGSAIRALSSKRESACPYFNCLFRPVTDSGDTNFSTLLEQARTGDRESLERLLRPRLVPLLQSARRRLGLNLDREIDAADLVQEVMMAATRAIVHFRGLTESAFDAWLRGILANQLRQVLRDRAPKVAKRRQLEVRDGSECRVDVEALQTSVFGRVERRQNLSLLERTIRWLPEHDRWILERKHLEGADVSWEVIAAEMNVSSESLRKKASRLYEVLRNGMRLIDRIEKRSIPEPIAEVVCLKYLRRLSINEIAQNVGRSIEQVKEDLDLAEKLLK